MALAENRWGKSEVRVSKVFAEDGGDDFLDITVQVLLEGDVTAAHTEGDNSHVLPTDTMRNTIYGLAQTSLTRDLEGFGEILCGHFLGFDYIDTVSVGISERRWQRHSDKGFVGGGSERRLARVVRGERD